MTQNKKINLSDVLKKGMNSEVGWEFKGKISSDIIMLKKPTRYYVEIIYKNLDMDLLKQAASYLGFVVSEGKREELSQIPCAKCPLFKDCSALINSKELDYSAVYKSGIRSLLGGPIIKFFGRIIRIYELEPSLRILENYEELLAESKDKIRDMMLYGTS